MAHKYKQLSLDWVKKNFPRIPETENLFEEIAEFDEFVEEAAAAMKKNEVDDRIMNMNSQRQKDLEPIFKRLRAGKWTDPKTKKIPSLLEEMSNMHKVFVRELTGHFDIKRKSDEGTKNKLQKLQKDFADEILASKKGADIIKTKLDTIDQAIADIKKLQAVVFKDPDWMPRWRSLKNEYEKGLQQMDASQKSALKKPFDELATSLAKQIQTNQDLKKRVESLLTK